MNRQLHDVFLDHDGEKIESHELDFLLDEGLDLLADYRKIADVGVRRSLSCLVKALANGKITEAP